MVEILIQQTTMHLVSKMGWIMDQAATTEVQQADNISRITINETIQNYYVGENRLAIDMPEWFPDGWDYVCTIGAWHT